jgi:hypothetical protein
VQVPGSIVDSSKNKSQYGIMYRTALLNPRNTLRKEKNILWQIQPEILGKELVTLILFRKKTHLYLEALTMAPCEYPREF